MIRNTRELGANLQKIITRLQANQNLLKLLYYTDKDPLSKADLTETQIQKEVFNKLIKITPDLKINDEGQSIVGVRVTDGFVAGDNDQFRNIIIDFEIWVPLRNWMIKDVNLRPFAIIGELQESLNGKTINGLGKMRCGDFSLSFVTGEASCYILHAQITEYD